MSGLVRIGILMVLLTAAGTVGLYVLEDEYSVVDALYMTIITLTTVGFKEVGELSDASRIFIMLLLVLGLAVFLMYAKELGELVARTQIGSWLERRKMDTALKTVSDHFVVCGFGRMGQSVCRQLADRGLRFVAIDRDEDLLADCQSEGWHWLVGDATDDRTLQNAGINRARGLAAVLGSDADNLYIVLSARLISKNLQILARASDPKGAEKMARAGANRVISLYATGAAKLVQLLTNPNVEDFIEIFTAHGRELDLAEIQVSSQSRYADLKLADTDFSRRGVMVIGIRPAEGELLLPPPSSTTIRSGDSLILVGNTANIREICTEA